jgi:hypothetical protein
MIRWIAVAVIVTLAGLVSGYVIDAPLASSAAGAWRETATFLDGGAAGLVAILGYKGAVAGPLVLGALLCLPVLALPLRSGPGRRGPVPLPAPVWRPEPLAASLGEENRIGRPQGVDTQVALSRPIVLVRKPRLRSRDWFGDPSWLGGLPRLGNAPWPRDRDGTALPFAAQIDLAEIAGACPEAPLPPAGSLAFFLGTGAVVPVPAGNHDFTSPPEDFEHGFFPFWPVDPSAVDLPDDGRAAGPAGNEEAVAQAISAWLARRYPLREGPLAAAEPVDRIWWHGAIQLADCYRLALHAASRLADSRMARTSDAREDLELLGADPAATALLLETAQRAFDREGARLKEHRTQQDALAEVSDAMDRFTEDRDPWVPLTSEEFAVLRDVLAHVERDCADLVRAYAPKDLPELATLTLRAMISGPPEALAHISDAELTRINAGYRLAGRRQHGLFCPGGRAAQEDRHGDVLLLQLAHDDMMEWNWSETGLYQFRIKPADLERHRWDRASLRFETA